MPEKEAYESASSSRVRAWVDAECVYIEGEWLIEGEGCLWSRRGARSVKDGTREGDKGAVSMGYDCADSRLVKENSIVCVCAQK